ncbi:MAG: amidohydrolase family protein, partial [Clostridia bacterium]|nr:amidohydrolase family protein [Clostridia bacterium]
GAASNNDMDMLGEMALAGLIHKGKGLDPTLMTPEDIISMATVNGAKALGFDNTGCIKVGKDADIILVNMDTLHNTPMPDPVHALIYSTKGSDVDTVIIGGRIVMQNRELKTIDEERAKYNAIKSINSLL